MSYIRGILLLMMWLTYACSSPKTESNTQMDKKSPSITSESGINLSLNQANNLAKLPLNCIQTEYPNKLGQVISDSTELKNPKALHPSFYGCFDWHSAVHGHWSLVALLKAYPNLEQRKQAISKLKENLSKSNIEKEVDYFLPKHNSSYERTYGWAWLLKLAAELHTWDDPVAKELEDNLQPLTDLIAQKYLTFLPKLIYPIRVGEHTNTAFGLSFAYDYALVVGDQELKNVIEKRAMDYYANDIACPLTWEPSGYDFLSPCFEEIDLMRKVLPKDKFKTWFTEFLPSANDTSFKLAVGKVSDRKDGKLVHLDGLNFSRAWVIYGLTNQYPEYAYLNTVADAHMQHSLPNLVNDSYEGGHWLASFAIYALQENTKNKK